MERKKASLVSLVGIILLAAGWLIAQSRPVYPQGSSLYVNPQRVDISGYNGSAMEPFISLDGRFLFFNNDDDPRAPNKSIMFARRSGPLSFSYLGELPGVNLHVREKVEAAPSMDRQGRFYFTSTTSYERDRHTVMVGNFDGTRVTNVHIVEGDINRLQDGELNMDMNISPDGNTLYVSKARLGLMSLVTHAPVGVELLIARREGNRFNLDPYGAYIMKNVNAGLDYAPAITDDGLELYFNHGPGKIMVATRASTSEPFSIPQALDALGRGVVEGASISLDRRELFFHKSVDGTCCAIYRAVRSQ